MFVCVCDQQFWTLLTFSQSLPIMKREKVTAKQRNPSQLSISCRRQHPAKKWNRETTLVFILLIPQCVSFGGFSKPFSSMAQH